MVVRVVAVDPVAVAAAVGVVMKYCCDSNTLPSIHVLHVI